MGRSPPDFTSRGILQILTGNLAVKGVKDYKAGDTEGFQYQQPDGVPPSAGSYFIQVTGREYQQVYAGQKKKFTPEAGKTCFGIDEAANTQQGPGYRLYKVKYFRSHIFTRGR